MNIKKLQSQVAEFLEDNKRGFVVKFLEKKYPNLIEKCTIQAKKLGIPLAQHLYSYIYTEPQCPTCGGVLRFISFRAGYTAHCSKTCTQLDKTVRDVHKSTMLKRYGVEHSSQSPELEIKRLQTNLDRYGYEHPISSPKTKEKTKLRNFQKYGVFSCGSGVPEIAKKIKNTIRTKYGVDFPMQSSIVKKNRDKAMLAKYGVRYSVHNPESKKKMEATCLRRYGARSSLGGKTTQSKIRTTNFLKYGYAIASKSKQVKNRVRTTNMKRYGGAAPMSSSKVLRRTKQTCIQKYGVDSYSKTPDFQEKFEATMIARYGVPYPMQSQDLFEKNQKSAYLAKEFTIRKKKFCVRGYEPKVIRWLVRHGVSENNIATTKAEGLPSIGYLVKGKKHLYFPDMLVNDKVLVEVKSEWTLGITRHSNEVFRRVKVKARAAVENGYKFRLALVVDNRVLIIRNLENKTKSQVQNEVAQRLLS